MTEEVQAIEDGLTSEVYDLDQIVNENQNLKKKLGDQGNEIGQLRKVADQVLQNQLASQQPQEDDWDFDPVQKEMAGLKSELSSIKQEAALRDLQVKHPGCLDLAKDESFAGWVQDSNYRSNLYAKADSMDFSAADELFTAWEESQEKANMSHDNKRTNRNKALKNASMETGSSGGVKKTYFSRTALIDMRINNPAKYEAMSDEIKQAYNEGRVKK